MSSLITDFLIDCFSEMDLSLNLQILNTCKEWRNIMLDVVTSNSKVHIGRTYTLKQQRCTRRDEESTKRNNNSIGLCGILDFKSLICHCSPEYRISANSSVVVLESHLNNRLFLCSLCSNFNQVCLIDAKYIDDISEMQIHDAASPDYYLVHTDENGFKIQTSTRRFDTWMWFDGYGLLPLDYFNIFRNKKDAETRISMLSNITAGDKIELVSQKTKHMVELIVPSQNEMNELPLWYLPLTHRYPNTVIIKEHERYINIPLHKIGTISKSSKISSYCCGAEILQVGYYVVLYAPGFPLGCVNFIGDKYYTVKIEGIRYHLRYGQPLYKIFEKRKNAERWRSNKLTGLKEKIDKIRPGDIIMKTFINRFSIKPNQTYSVVKRITIEEKASIPMEELDRFLVINHLDEESSSSEGKNFF
jgi:hypothetical protein